MKIQKLLEAELFRNQSEWFMNSDPIIQMPARQGRVGHASPCVPFGVTYALSKCGIRVPKRWNSTFTTTNPKQSLFVAMKAGGATRKVIVPPKTKVGFVVSDFNDDNMHEEFGMKKLLHACGDAIFAIKDGSFRDQATRKMLTDWISKFLLSGKEQSDETYSSFLKLVKTLDRFFTKIEQPTYTERAIALIKPFIENKTIGVATVATVPDGNYEVWFEGPYDAEKIKRVELADQPE